MCRGNEERLGLEFARARGFNEAAAHVPRKPSGFLS